MKHNIVIPQGADQLCIDATWTEDDALVNLTGYTARMQIRTLPEAAGDPLAEFTTANGRIVLGGAAGTVKVTCPNAISSAIVAGTHAYDLELLNASSLVTKLLYGSVTVLPEVTR